QPVRPAFVIGGFQVEQEGIARAFQEFTVIAEGSFHRRVRPETFVPVVVVLVGLPAIPAGAAFDPKMIIAFPGQPAVSVARFQNTLRQGYARRSAPFPPPPGCCKSGCILRYSACAEGLPERQAAPRDVPSGIRQVPGGRVPWWLPTSFWIRRRPGTGKG